MSFNIARRLGHAAGLAFLGTALCGLAQNQAIYTDSLQGNWQNWSWDTTINLANTSPVHSGSDSIAVTITAEWGALYLDDTTAFNSSPYTNLTFWINGGASGGQILKLQGLLNGATPTNYVQLGPLAAATWQQVAVPLSTLGVANKPNMNGLWLQDLTGGPQPTFYVDDILLVTNSTPPPTVTLTSPTDGSTYTAPASIPLAANVVSNGQTITKVQFYSNGTNLVDED
ncbi:MAG TPA: Ig-like domain-containing protein, partial [Candidatus Acidoferrum sp.]|nr:Ig-like domain-containing protein [Candidatus Acidoferrum sp.]